MGRMGPIYPEGTPGEHHERRTWWCYTWVLKEEEYDPHTRGVLCTSTRPTQPWESVDSMVLDVSTHVWIDMCVGRDPWR